MAGSHHPREDQMTLFGADAHDIVREAWDQHPNAIVRRTAMLSGGHELVLLRGPTLLHAETLQEIATLGEDGQWRTREGTVTDSIDVPHAGARRSSSPAHCAKPTKAQDAAWLEQALTQLTGIARRQREIIVDDCWVHITMPPRTPSLMSALMVAAGREGVIETTEEHRRSTRPTNGGRTVRVWRSLIYTPPA
jgi:hypothetical protein